WPRSMRPPCSTACGSSWTRSWSTSGVWAPGALSVQARAHSGCRLSVLAAVHQAAVPPAHCPGVGDAGSSSSWNATRAVGIGLHVGGARCAGPALLAAGGPASQFYGRNAGYPAPPVQSRTCSFPASGSSVVLASAVQSQAFRQTLSDVEPP